MKSFNGFKEVFSKPFYILTALCGAILFYMLNVIVSDFSELGRIARDYESFEAIEIVFNYFIGFPNTIDSYSVFVVFTVALLFGLYISLATFKITQVKKSSTNNSIIGSIGVFFGFIATGCVACGVGLASALGFGGAFLYLPFGGFDISLI